MQKKWYILDDPDGHIERFSRENEANRPGRIKDHYAYMGEQSVPSAANHEVMSAPLMQDVPAEPLKVTKFGI